VALDPNCRGVREGNSGKRLGSLKAPSAWHRICNLPLKEELLMAKPAGSQGYGENATLAQQYESITFEEVHCDVLLLTIYSYRIITKRSCP
jgi:hypothetical protein